MNQRILPLEIAMQRIGALRLAGILLGIAGVGVLFGPELLAGRATTLAGMAAVLLAALSYGCAGVWGMRLRAVPPLVSSCCQLICSAAIIAVLAAAIEAPWRLAMPGAVTILAVLLLAVVSTALAYIVFYRILVAAGGTNAMLVTLLMPPLAIVLGVALLGESFSSRHALGALIIAVALLTIDGRLLQRLLATRHDRR